jgi:hypothetical protein
MEQERTEKAVAQLGQSQPMLLFPPSGIYSGINYGGKYSATVSLSYSLPESEQWKDGGVSPKY